MGYNNMDNAKLMERLQAAEQRAETFRLGKLQLVHDLEQGFSKVCEFMQEQYNKSPDDEVTARWFKHIISDLRTSCESEAQQNKIEPMREEDSNVMQKFTESDASFLDNMDLGFSGINSFSPRGVGYGTSFQTTYGNSMAAFPHASKREADHVMLQKVISQKRKKMEKNMCTFVQYVIRVLLVHLVYGTIINTCTMQLHRVGQEVNRKKLKTTIILSKIIIIIIQT